MDIKTYIAAAVVALTAACSQEAPVVEQNETVNESVDSATDVPAATYTSEVN
jgi:uncharacterized lipoprotein